MLVKICGIQTPEMAESAVASGTDFIGLVFADSKRQVTVQQAKMICAAIAGESVKVVGVFRNQTLDEINQIVEAVPLDLVQLHGNETVNECRQLAVPLIKAFSFDELAFAQTYQDAADYFLIDSPKPGSGIPFDWRTLKRSEHFLPTFLAGGLNPENVREAIAQTNPVGVDVSSGVETDGKKDPAKIQRFIQQVKQERKRMR